MFDYSPNDADTIAPVEDILQTMRLLERGIEQQSSRRLVRSFLSGLALTGGLVMSVVTDSKDNHIWAPPALLTGGVVLALAAFNAHMRHNELRAEFSKATKVLDTMTECSSDPSTLALNMQ